MEIIDELSSEIFRILMVEARLTAKEIDSLRSIHDVISAIEEFVGGNRQAVERFIRYCTIYSSYQIGIDVSEPDVTMLLKFWKSLSVYCHAQKKPQETWQSTQWIQDGYACLEAVLEYLKAITQTRGLIQISSLPPEAHDLLNKYVDNELDEDAVKTRLKLMKPIIEARPR